MQKKYHIGKLIAALSDNAALLIALDNYIAVIMEKGLEGVCENDIDSELLFSENVIVITNNLVRPENYGLVATGLYSYFKSKVSLEIYSEFGEYLGLYKNLSRYFKATGYSPVKEELKRWFMALILLEYTANGGTFAGYIRQLAALEGKTKGKKQLYEFANAYGSVLSELQIEKDILYADITQLIALTESNVTYNGNQFHLLEGLRDLPAQKRELALSLFDYACQAGLTPGKLISALATGLYESLGLTFLSEVAVLYLGNNAIAERIFLGLSVVKELEVTDACIYLQYFEKYKDTDEYITIALSKMLLRVLESAINFTDNETITLRCIEALEFGMTQYGYRLALQVIDRLTIIEGYVTCKTRLLLHLVAQPYFNTNEFMGVIVRLYWYVHDVESLKRVLSAIADKEPFSDLGKHFTGFQNHCDKNELDLAIIELVTDNRSSRRELGNSLFGADHNHSRYVFTFDILTLIPLQQYKLWVGLCQNIGEPKHYLVALLPLLNSRSWTVQESFIAKLEELSEDYAGHIVKILEDHLHLHNRPDVIERIRGYSEQFFRINADCKIGISEISPHKTQNKLFKEFNKHYNRSFSRTIEKGAKENSLMSILGKPVKLGKGGGWKISETEGIKKLGHIQTGMTLPRGMFIYPEQYDIMCGLEQSIDRTEEEFDLVRELIKNE